MTEPTEYMINGAIEDPDEIEVFFKTLEEKYPKEYGKGSTVVGEHCYNGTEVHAYGIEGLEVYVANGSFRSPQVSKISPEYFSSILIWDEGAEILRAKAQHKLEEMTGYELGEVQD